MEFKDHFRMGKLRFSEHLSEGLTEFEINLSSIKDFDVEGTSLKLTHHKEAEGVSFVNLESEKVAKRVYNRLESTMIRFPKHGEEYTKCNGLKVKVITNCKDLNGGYMVVYEEVESGKRKCCSYDHWSINYPVHRMYK